ncbi:hypothetical protein ACJ41O_015238 [Fusarium nematophilum]
MAANPSSIEHFTQPECQTNDLVTFDSPGDPYNPRNWPLRRKALSTVLYGLSTMGSTFSTASFSTAVPEIAQEFRLSLEVASLGTSLILMGFGIGPLIWAPVSELHGRKLPMVVPYFLATCFIFGTAAAKDTQTVMITRFMSGFFGSAPLCITGGVLADMFDLEHRALALTGYALAVIGGPVFGGTVVHANLGWRWTQFVTGILMVVMVVMDVCLLSESYAPVLLARKARRLRMETRNWSYHAKHEEWDATVKEMVTKFLLRPTQLLLTPICFFGALHASFVYGIVYLNLGAFPVIFQQTRGWNELIGNLPFLGLLIGACLGSCVNAWCGRWYLARLKASSGQGTPEDRLPPMMIGAVSLTLGLFLIGNTADPGRYSWVLPAAATVAMGLGFFMIFQSVINYQIDTFPRYAASAVAANTFMRSMIASIFLPIVPRMYSVLGVKSASNLLGFIALAMVPIPWVFFYFGRRIRARGRWSRNA